MQTLKLKEEVLCVKYRYSLRICFSERPHLQPLVYLKLSLLAKMLKLDNCVAGRTKILNVLTPRELSVLSLKSNEC